MACNLVAKLVNAGKLTEVAFQIEVGVSSLVQAGSIK
jgi:hypothetical protein